MTTILHICTRQDWEKAQVAGEYRPASLETEGFIHASRPEQILGVANRFYRGTNDLLLLVLDVRHLYAEIRWETADGEVFPHVYGPLNLEAIVAVVPLQSGEDGEFHQLPDLESFPRS
jgi:uncharacterized protein (DUF952 family)